MYVPRLHSPPRLGLERRWVFFGLAALSILMSAIDGTIVAVALPTFIRDLDASLTWAGWTLTAYALTQTIMLPLAGKLAEQFGQLRVFLTCIVLFTLGSLLCSLAPNIYVLIACRVVQAVGSGGLYPVAVGIVAQQFPKTRSRMVGLFASIFPIGAILGPNIGGVIIEQFGWRQVFWINVTLGLAMILLLARAARAEAPARPAKRRSIDVLGAALFALTVVAPLSGLTLLGDNPALIGSPFLWLLFAAGGAALVLFVRQERRAPDPVVDLELVVRQPFLVVNVFGVLTGACFMGFFSFIPYFATVQYGFGPLESGAILTPRSIVMIAVSTSISFLLHRLGYRLPMLAGIGCVAGALLLLGQGVTGIAIGPIETGPVVPLLLMMSLSGLGMGMLIPASNNAGLDLLPQRAAVVSGIRGLFNSTGGVIGTAIIVLWLELSPDKAAGMRTIFTVLGVVMVLTAPLVLLIPDGARERRQATARKDAARPEPAAAASPSGERLAASTVGRSEG